MYSRHFLLFSFMAALNSHYQARLASFEFPVLTTQILKLTLCLHREGLIQHFYITKGGRYTSSLGKRGICLLLRYTEGQNPVFSKLTPITKFIPLTHRQLYTWIHRKASLLFPILVIETSRFGYLTDSQLVYLRLQHQVPNYLGGRLIAIIKE